MHRFPPHKVDFSVISLGFSTQFTPQKVYTYFPPHVAQIRSDLRAPFCPILNITHTVGRIWKEKVVKRWTPQKVVKTSGIDVE